MGALEHLDYITVGAILGAGATFILLNINGWYVRWMIKQCGSMYQDELKSLVSELKMRQTQFKKLKKYTEEMIVHVEEDIKRIEDSVSE